MTGDRPSTLVDLGLDFGSTGLRAVYSVPGKPARFVALADAQWPWLLCEPTPSGPLPVSFPSIKSRLGSVGLARCDGEFVDPFEVVVRGLDAARRLVEATASAGIGRTVISVPARFALRQRAALRDAAGEAGFTDVGLIDDSVAAVIAHTRGTQDGVFLVCSMGYSGTELGLVRAARGQYQALGHESSAAPGGSTFDEEVLTWLIRVLRKSSGSPDPSQWDEARWRRLRDNAQRIKEELGASAQEICHGVVCDDAGTQVAVDIKRARFETLLQPYVELIVDRAQVLLAQSGLTPADVGTVLSVGASAQLGQITSLIAGLGHQFVPGSPEYLARGAAWQAERLGGVIAAGSGERVVTMADEPADTPSHGVEEARRLIDQGRSDEAATLLRKTVEQARVLLEELAAPAPSALPRLLLLARSLLRQKQYEAAIGASHRAWQEEPTRPDVFEVMIDIHCAAAMADPDVARFSDADRWLRCAYGHDPSNTRVRGSLAERTYLHANELSRLGRYRESFQALQQCLAWDPDHRAARELRHRLSRTISVRSRGATGGRDEP
ncbi:MAG: Hsp70 family protein [Pseudonocardiaceae bacterium]